MNNFKSWSKLFVLVLFVFAFVGCGGGGGGTSRISSEITQDMSGWDTAPTPQSTTPEPVTPQPITPEPKPEPTQPEPTPVTPEPEPINPDPTPEPEPEPITPEDPEPVTPEPVQPDTEPAQPEPITPDAYTDTYDIASVLEGEWYGMSGSGTATNANGTYNIRMYKTYITITDAQIIGNYGTMYVTYRENWDYDNLDELYSGGVLLHGDDIKINITHTGVNTWRSDNSDGTILIITITSDTTAIVTQESTIILDNISYHYSAKFTLQKISSIPNDNYVDAYDFTRLTQGTWYGVSGNGSATSSDGTYKLKLSQLNFSVFEPKISGNTGTAYITNKQHWSCYSPVGDYIGEILLSCDYERMELIHIGANTWYSKDEHGTFYTIQIAADTVLIEQEGTLTMENITYYYSIIYTARKY